MLFWILPFVAFSVVYMGHVSVSMTARWFCLKLKISATQNGAKNWWAEE